MRSFTRAGPTKAVSRLMLDIDRQLPSVRAIGNPIRVGFGADAQIAAGGDAGAAAGAGAGDRGDGRDAALFELREHAVDAGFVFERVLRRGEGAKLIDVGARGKRLVAGALEHQHLDGTVAIGLVANCGEPLIHREGEGIARLRAIERDPADAVAQLVEDVLRRVL